jgi:hypothetical protein
MSSHNLCLRPFNGRAHAQTPAYVCRKCTLVQREPRPLITTRIRRLRKLGTARDMGMSGGPAGERGPYQMRRGKWSCRRYGGSGALPAAWKSWEDGGPPSAGPLPSTPLECWAMGSCSSRSLGRRGVVHGCNKISRLFPHGSLIFRAVCKNRDRASYRCPRRIRGA